jgi:hypothetical protein
VGSALGDVRSDFLGWGRTPAGDRVVAPGDHLQAAYNLWLPGHELRHGRAPWRDPYSFRPETDGRTNVAAWPFGLVYGPLRALLGTVSGWNAFLLLTYVGAGGLTALWLRSLGLPPAAALVGGVAFALAPYRSAQTAAGHLLGPVALFLPLSLWALEARLGWLAIAALASIPLSGQVHLALGAIPFVAAYATVRGRTRVGLVAAGIAVAAGLLVYAVAIRGTVGAGGRSFAQVERYSAEPLDLVARHARHGLESLVFLGWLLPVLAVAGVVLARDRRLAAVLAAGVVVPVVLALGSHTPLYEPLWHVVPGLRHTRVPERLLPVACLSLAALAAIAVARVPWRWAPLAAIPLLALDLRVSLYRPLGSDEHNPVYAAIPAAGRVLERPVYVPDRQEGSVYLYYAMQTPRERPTGYSTTAEPEAVLTARRLQAGDPGVLRELGVHTVVTFEHGRPRRLATVEP